MTLPSETIAVGEAGEKLDYLEKQADAAKKSIFDVGVTPVEKSSPDEIQRFDQAPVEKVVPYFEKWVDAEIDYWIEAGKEERKEGHMGNVEATEQMGFEIVARQIKDGTGSIEKTKKLLEFLGEEQLEYTDKTMKSVSNKDVTENVAGVNISKNQEFVNYGEARTQVVNNLLKHYIPDYFQR